MIITLWRLNNIYFVLFGEKEKPILRLHLLNLSKVSYKWFLIEFRFLVSVCYLFHLGFDYCRIWSMVMGQWSLEWNFHSEYVAILELAIDNYCQGFAILYWLKYLGLPLFSKINSSFSNMFSINLSLVTGFFGILYCVVCRKK